MVDHTVKLQEGEARYRSLFNNMPGGVALHEIITDTGGNPINYRFLEINPAFERHSGQKREEVIGKTICVTVTDVHWTESCGKVALTGEPAHFHNYSAALHRWYEVSPIPDNAPQYSPI